MFKNDDMLHSSTFYRMSTPLGAFITIPYNILDVLHWDVMQLYLQERPAETEVNCDGWSILPALTDRIACPESPYPLPWQELLSCKILVIPAAADILLYRPSSLKSHMAGGVVSLADPCLLPEEQRWAKFRLSDTLILISDTNTVLQYICIIQLCRFKANFWST